MSSLPRKTWAGNTARDFIDHVSEELTTYGRRIPDAKRLRLRLERAARSPAYLRRHAQSIAAQIDERLECTYTTGPVPGGIAQSYFRRGYHGLLNAHALNRLRASWEAQEELKMMSEPEFLTERFGPKVMFCVWPHVYEIENAALCGQALAALLACDQRGWDDV